VIIDDLDVGRPRRGGWPLEADAPLIVDPNAVLSFSVSLQPLETVPGKVQIGNLGRRVQLIQLHLRLSSNAVERLYPPSFRKVARPLVSIAGDHPWYCDETYAIRQAYYTTKRGSRAPSLPIGAEKENRSWLIAEIRAHHHVRDRDAQPAQRRAAREHLWIMRDTVEHVFHPLEAERPGAAARVERGPTDYECAPGVEPHNFT
jgi:hypothetical protein